MRLVALTFLLLLAQDQGKEEERAYTVRFAVGGTS